MKIGFFGGSFDPIHLGHINLAISLKERKGLDEVWLCPANISPHKQKMPVENDLRLQMIQLAIQEIAGLKVIDIESKRPGPSYTVQTLKELQEIFPNHEWHLILGEDCLRNFKHWKEPDEILKIAHPIVGSRFSLDPIIEKNWTSEQKIAFESGWEKIPIFDISSTEIRNRLKSGLYCGHLLPAKVLDFITKNGLYSYRYEKSRPN